MCQFHTPWELNSQLEIATSVARNGVLTGEDHTNLESSDTVLFGVVPRDADLSGEFQNLYAVWTVAPVPEPEIYAMMGVGLGLVGWAARRRKRQVA
jgi:hypothetical protein